MLDAPQFAHDCNLCTFLGRFTADRPYDLYYADHGGLPDTVIARYGDDGPEYTSGLILADRVPALGEAVRRSRERGLLPNKEPKQPMADTSSLHPMTYALERAVTFAYTNWRGETATRRVVPGRLYFGTTEYHPTPQWLLVAFDLDKQAERTFTLADISGWAPLAPLEEPHA